MENALLEKAFLEFRKQLLRLAERTLAPALSRRFSPEDLLQETFAALQNDTSRFMSDEAVPLYIRLRTALLQTAAELTRRHLAAQKRDARREVTFGDAGTSPAIDAVPDSATSPLSRLARDERDALLRRVLATLPPADRGILELRHMDGLGNGDCATVLGISEKASSLRYYRALTRLRAALGAYSEFRP